MDHPDRPVPEPLEPALAAAVTALADVGRLLVATDYDGVLAPIGPDPSRAFPVPSGVAALRGLAAIPGTTVAVVSGRTRADLVALTGLPEPIRLVGGHGAELGDDLRLTPEQAALRERLREALPGFVHGHPGVWLEEKPASLVVHTRPAPAEVGAAVREAVRAGPGSWPGVHVGTGKEVVELAVVDTHKGTAVAALREQTAADAVAFLGDDVTDENAFAVLGPADVGVKVGPGQTRARYRVPDIPAAVRVLELLRHARAAGRSG